MTGFTRVLGGWPVNKSLAAAGAALDHPDTEPSGYSRFHNSRSAVLFWGCSASGAAALIYEIVWHRALTNMIGGNVYSTSVLLAAFLAGLAIGGRWSGHRLTQRQDHVRIFGLLQLAIGFFGVATLFIIRNLRPVYAGLFYLLRDNFAVFSVAQMVLVFLIMLVPTSLMGAGIPVVIEAWSLRVKDAGKNAGDIYSINTWGAVAGSLMAGFVLVPAIGLRMTNLTAVAINLAIAMTAFVIAGHRRDVTLAVIVSLAVVGLAFIKGPQGVKFGYAVADHYQSYAEFQSSMKGASKLFDEEGAYGRVQVFRSPGGVGHKPDLFLVSGGRFEGSTGNDAISMNLLAYLPLAIHDRPRDFLNIGLGTGRTMAVAAGDPRLRAIDNVEINPLIYKAVDKYFQPRLLSDKRVHRISDDARHYLTYSHKKYDIVVSQPSYPTRKSVAHLFTKEYYEIVSERLNKDGVFVQWLPRYLLNKQELATAVKTVKTVFPQTYAWDLKNIDVYLVALKSKRSFDPEIIDAKIKGMDKDGWKSKFAAGPDDLEAVLGDPSIPINTDDLPHIEFVSARNKVTGTGQPIKR